jgi:uncharacterized protein YggT (Ycf19 family)
MAQDTQRVEETITQAGDTVQKTTQTQSLTADSGHSQNVAARIVWFVTGALLVLLGFRFVLSLLGANTTNSFASFIYNLSHPFVAPFFSLFSYQNTFEAAHLEVYTLVAMAVYALVAWGIVKLLTLNRAD